MKSLTDLQKYVLVTMRHRGLHWIADETEKCWKRGQTYYIDRRVGKAKGIRRAFNKANKQALQVQ